MGSGKGDHPRGRARTNRSSRPARCFLVILPLDMRFALRRFVGIVSGICALYLTVGAVDAPCKDHSRDGASPSGVAPKGHHAGSHHELPVKKGAPKPCKSVAIPCCIAMTSCGTTI